jgi:hypothetical protein
MPRRLLIVQSRFRLAALLMLPRALLAQNSPVPPIDTLSDLRSEISLILAKNVGPGSSWPYSRPATRQLEASSLP